MYRRLFGSLVAAATAAARYKLVGEYRPVVVPSGFELILELVVACDSGNDVDVLGNSSLPVGILDDSCSIDDELRKILFLFIDYNRSII